MLEISKVLFSGPPFEFCRLPIDLDPGGVIYTWYTGVRLQPLVKPGVDDEGHGYDFGRLKLRVVEVLESGSNWADDHDPRRVWY